MDLTLLTQKINNYTQVVGSWGLNVGKLYFDSNPQDVAVKLLDNDGNVIDATIPNMAKYRDQLWSDMNEAIALFDKHIYIDSLATLGVGDGTDANPFKTIKEALDSVPTNGRAVIRYKCDNSDNYVYEIDEDISIYGLDIEFTRWNSGTSKILFKQRGVTGLPSTIKSYGNCSLTFDRDIKIIADDETITHHSPALFSPYKGKFRIVVLGGADIGTKGVSLVGFHSAFGASADLIIYYNQIVTNSSGYLLSNDGHSLVSLNAYSTTYIDNWEYAIRSILRDTDSGNPINVVSNHNFSL